MCLKRGVVFIGTVPSLAVTVDARSRALCKSVYSQPPDGYPVRPHVQLHVAMYVLPARLGDILTGALGYSFLVMVRQDTN